MTNTIAASLSYFNRIDFTCCACMIPSLHVPLCRQDHIATTNRYPSLPTSICEICESQCLFVFCVDQAPTSSVVSGLRIWGPFLTMVKGLAAVNPVRNIGDSFKWVEHCLWVTLHHCGEQAGGNIATSMATSTLSSAFSGIGAAEMSLEMLAGGLRAFVDPEARSPRNLWAAEWKKESQWELRMHKCPPRHIYDDVTNFLHVGSAVQRTVRMPR